MTGLLPLPAPETQAKEERPHACGRCRNPWGVVNNECPGFIRDRNARWIAEIDAFEFHA
jgi:hypothetical protein